MIRWQLFLPRIIIIIIIIIIITIIVAHLSH